MSLLRMFWKLFRLGRDYRDMADFAIGCLSANERHGGKVGEGVELTVWKFPPGSIHGDAACLFPCQPDRAPETTLTTSGGPETTWHRVNFRKGGSHD
jgi:hypothetical protein